ncbi:MAG: site-2 protease family protein [Actinobacteria bacterium]|nr:site-2 protease family protein [Actinomycetota bacterium]
MFGGSQPLPLFRVAGVSVTAGWSWLLALGYVVFLLLGSFNDVLGPGKDFEAFAYAVALSFLFFGSIVLHEFGHAIVARRNGVGILGIELWLLGGLAKMDRDPATPGAEFRVAAAGPLVTAVVAAACLGVTAAAGPDQFEHLAQMTAQPGDEPWLVGIAWLGMVNALLLVFNLFPAYPLDGGRIARAAVWKLTGDEARGTSFAAALGRVFGAGLMILGVLLLGGNPFAGVIFIYMGFSIMQSARGIVAQRGLLGDATRLTVADVMDTRPVVMAGDVSADRALEEYFWRYHWQWFPVVDLSGRFVGLVEQQQAESVDETERAARSVDELVDRSSVPDRSISQDTPLTAVLANHNMRDFGALMAVDDHGVLTGVVTIEQVQRGLRDAIARAAGAPGGNPPPPTV